MTKSQARLKGFSLLEILVVVTIFAVISLVTSQAIILTLIGTHKADTISKVRQNLDYAIISMERQLHNAKAISQCPNIDDKQISFTDQNNALVTFSCVGTNTQNLPSYIASSSAALTSSDLTITACSFVCNPGTTSAPPFVTINIKAKQLQGTSTISSLSGGQNNAEISITTQVTLRSY